MNGWWSESTLGEDGGELGITWMLEGVATAGGGGGGGRGGWGGWLSRIGCSG